jgi:hypothetical protein
VEHCFGEKLCETFIWYNLVEQMVFDQNTGSQISTWFSSLTTSLSMSLLFMLLSASKLLVAAAAGLAFVSFSGRKILTCEA